MRVGVAYADGAQQTWHRLEVPDGATVQVAIERGLFGMVPHIDLAAKKAGVFGKVVKLAAVLQPGDRVEVYRPITCDQVPRRNGDSDDA